MIVDRGAVHRRSGDVVLLTEHIDPAVLVTACETSVDPAPGQMIEDGEFLRCSDRVPAGKHQTQWRKFDPLSAGRKIGVEHQRRHRGLVALRVEMVLSGREDVEANLIGKDYELAQLL